MCYQPGNITEIFGDKSDDDDDDDDDNNDNDDNDVDKVDFCENLVRFQPKA